MVELLKAPTPKLVRQADRDLGKEVYAQHQEAVQRVIDKIGDPLRIRAWPRRKLHRLYFGDFHVDVQTVRRFLGPLLRYETKTEAKIEGRYIPLDTKVKVVRAVVPERREAAEIAAEIQGREGDTTKLERDLAKRVAG